MRSYQPRGTSPSERTSLLRGALIHVLVPICTGAMLYLLLRSPSLLVFHWVDAIGMTNPLLTARGIVDPFRTWSPQWALYSLPDGLWVYAITACMAMIWRNGQGAVGQLWVWSGFALGAGSELGQAIGVVPGTFDLADFVATAFAGFAAAMLVSRLPRKP
jgi:hypothetical protein